MATRVTNVYREDLVEPDHDVRVTRVFAEVAAQDVDLRVTRAFAEVAARDVDLRITRVYIEHLAETAAPVATTPFISVIAL
jgi:hypothetical protein